MPRPLVLHSQPTYILVGAVNVHSTVEQSCNLGRVTNPGRIDELYRWNEGMGIRYAHVLSLMCAHGVRREPGDTQHKHTQISDQVPISTQDQQRSRTDTDACAHIGAHGARTHPNTGTRTMLAMIAILTSCSDIVVLRRELC